MDTQGRRDLRAWARALLLLALPMLIQGAAAGESTAAPVAFSSHRYIFHSADLNGDGVADSFLQSIVPGIESRIVYARKGGSAATELSKRASLALADIWMDLSLSHAETRLVLGDLNGDGRADYLLLPLRGTGAVSVLSEISGAPASQVHQRLDVQAHPYLSQPFRYQFSLKDINRDGRADLLVQPRFKEDGAWLALAHSSGELREGRRLSGGPASWSTQEWHWHWGDLNGDKIGDVVLQPVLPGIAPQAFWGTTDAQFQRVSIAWEMAEDWRPATLSMHLADLDNDGVAELYQQLPETRSHSAVQMLQLLQFGGQRRWMPAPVALSNQVTPLAAPGVPTNVRASPNLSTDGRITISWSQWTTQQFKLYQSKDGGSFNFVKDVSVAEDVMTELSGLGNGQYQYKVSACSNGLCSEPSAASNSVTVNTTQAVPATPGKPTFSGVEQETGDDNTRIDRNNSYTVHWSPVQGASYYLVERAGTAGRIEAWVNGTSYADGGYSNNTFVTYAIKACNNQGSCSGWSPASYIRIVLQRPGTPSAPWFSGVEISNPRTDTDGSYTVWWDSSSSSGAHFYRLEDQNGILLNYASSSTQSYTVNGQFNGTWTYRVYGCTSLECSPSSTAASLLVNKVVAPGGTALVYGGVENTVTNPVTDTNGNYTLTWSTVSGATRYELYEGATKIYYGANLSYSPPTKANGTYGYTAKACNAAGCSAASATLSIKVEIATIPLVPTLGYSNVENIATNPVTDTNGNYTLTWSTVSGATRYELYEGATKIYDGANLSYSPPTKANGTYGYTAKACNAAGCSAASTTLSVKVEIFASPAIPSNLRFSGVEIVDSTPPTDADGLFTLQWDTVANATSYKVTESGVEKPAVTGNSYTPSAPLANGDYSYTVKACNANGCSAASTAKQIKVQKASAETVTYQHTDTLGNVVGESTASGSFTRYHYKPYGERVESAPARLGYTGHLNQKELALTYMQARHYDPAYVRFLGNDPVGFDPNNVFSFNRYAYANNNPYRYKDPSGQIGVDAIVDAAFVLHDAGNFLGAAAAWAEGAVTGNAHLTAVAAEGMRETGGNLVASAASLAVPGLSAPMIRGGVKVVDGATDAAKAVDKSKSVNKAADISSESKKVGTPGNNQKQNKQFRDATQGLSKDQKRQLHDEISGKNLNFKEIKAIADEMKKAVSDG